MASDRIKVLVERLKQRFDPAEADELRRELDAAETEIEALRAAKERQAAEDASRPAASDDTEVAP